MIRLFLIVFCSLFIHHSIRAQSSQQLGDSIRIAFHIPELAFAVVSSDSIEEFYIGGVQRINSSFSANKDDRFRIGSNTKAITSFIAAKLVKQGLLSWNTRFFDIIPELKKQSNKSYHALTLVELLSFRTRLIPYTYTFAEPRINQFEGNDTMQRYQFIEWFLQQEPVKGKGKYHPSNLGYVAAALMMERVTHKSYEQLVKELGKELHIDFQFGAPNVQDTLQPWGHDETLQSESPASNQKLNWLMAAGNINVSLPGYIIFIQEQLKGLNGQSTWFTKKEFEFLHFGLSQFALGWFWEKQTDGSLLSYNIGNPGTFLSKVFVMPAQNKAVIIFTNAQTESADAGTSLLYEQLKKRYRLK